MRSLLLTILLLSVSVSMSAQQTGLNESSEAISPVETIKEAHWVAQYTKAARQAKKSNKPLLIFFTGSDYCGLCRQLNKYFFSSDEFVALADDKLILYIADFPRRTDIISPEKRKENEKLKTKYKVGGYPTIVMISSDGKRVLGKRMGFGFDHDTQYHFDLVKKAIKKNQ